MGQTSKPGSFRAVGKEAETIADLTEGNGETKGFNISPRKLSHTLATCKAKFGTDVIVPNRLKFPRSARKREDPGCGQSQGIPGRCGSRHLGRPGAEGAGRPVPSTLLISNRPWPSIFENANVPVFAVLFQPSDVLSSRSSKVCREGKFNARFSGHSGI